VRFSSCNGSCVAYGPSRKTNINGEGRYVCMLPRKTISIELPRVLGLFHPQFPPLKWTAGQDEFKPKTWCGPEALESCWPSDRWCTYSSATMPRGNAHLDWRRSLHFWRCIQNGCGRIKRICATRLGLPRNQRNGRPAPGHSEFHKLWRRLLNFDSSVDAKTRNCQNRC